MIEKMKLKQLREQTIYLRSQIQKKNESIVQMEKDPVIVNYHNSLQDIDILQMEYDEKMEKYKEMLKEECSHPLWYLTSYSCNMHFKPPIKLYNCKCLRCAERQTLGNEVWSCKGEFLFEREKAIFDYNEDEKMVQSKIPYETINEEFLELESEGYSFEEVREILFCKYTEKNEVLARNLKVKYIPKKEKERVKR